MLTIPILSPGVTNFFLNSPSYTRGPLGNSHLHTCNLPEKVVTVDLSGDCYLCGCEAYLPVSVGNILNFQKLEDIWASPIARHIQSTVKNKEYTYCATSHCGITEQDMIRNHIKIKFNIDDSCNLACPSCRKDMKMHTQGPEYEQKLKYVNHLLKLIEESKDIIQVILIASGDPLASYITRPFIKNWKFANDPSKEVLLCTNGLLMSKVLDGAEIVKNIIQYDISIDAGSAEVYKEVRKPGKFDILLDNLTWLKKNKSPHSKVILKMCVSKLNAFDIDNFVSLCREYDFIGNITKIDDWGVLDNFDNYAILDYPDHPYFQTIISQLTKIKDDPQFEINPYIRQYL